MEEPASPPIQVGGASLRPAPLLIALAVLSFVLAIITGPEQFY